jgi:hypothetical protein
MATTRDYRQAVSDFEARVDTMLRRRVNRRHIVDTTGNRSRDPGFRSDAARLAHYAQRRYASVARMFALLGMVRDTEQLAQRLPPVEVTASGANWQAFTGTGDNNACHTCPCLLLFNGQHPTRITKNRVLQRHLVVEFADCMLMPSTINGIDKIVDEKIGSEAFVESAAHMLHHAGAGWRDGLQVFDRGMSDIYVNAHAYLYGAPSQQQPRRNAEELVLEVVCAYCEGLEAARTNAVAVDNYRREVLRELGTA